MLLLNNNALKLTPSSNRHICSTPESTARPLFRKRIEGNSCSGNDTTYFGLKTLTTNQMNLRSLIGILFLINTAAASNAETKSWRLTASKSGGWASKYSWPSAIEVEYYPDEENLKYFKSSLNDNSGDWFTITRMIDHDEKNNRINVFCEGMKNRWIYYLEEDGIAFLKHLQDTKVEGLKNANFERDYKRGYDSTIFGFRVALHKMGNAAPMTNFLKKINKYFDSVSVRVYLNSQRKVAYLQIDNLVVDKNLGITSIDGYEKIAQTVIFRTSSDPQKFNGAPISGIGADRKLFLGREDPTGEEGKKLLKFLIEHRDDQTYFSDTRLEKIAKDTPADWQPLRRRRLVEVAYYSFIGFNMLLMCCLLVGISFAYHVGTHEVNHEPIRW